MEESGLRQSELVEIDEFDLDIGIWSNKETGSVETLEGSGFLRFLVIPVGRKRLAATAKGIR